MRSSARVRRVVKRWRLILRRVKVLGEARMVAKRMLEGASKAVWRVPLTRERTVLMLEGRQIQVARDGILHLPTRQPVSGQVPPQFGSRDVVFEPEFVWNLERDRTIRSIRIASSGTILLNRRYLLDTDFGSVAGVADRPLKKRHAEMDVAIVPWSHKWATYYEFVIHILSKLCWIREVVDASSWAQAKVCYPLLFTPYESQYLSLLEVGQGSLVNTRENVAIEARSTIISNLQRDNRLLTPSRLAALRRAFLSDQPPVTGGRRMYLSRAGWKRQVTNEAEVRRLASSYGLEVIESIPESVEEQIRMFSEASLVVSPHGSALTNLVWCTPGTRVIELFTKSFTPDLYACISAALGLRHSYLVDDAAESHHWTNMHKDMVVDIRSLASAIERADA